MLLNSILTLLALHVAGLHAQTAVTSAPVATDNNATVLQQQPIDKPAGLPNVEWDILRIDPSARENLCQRQIAYCANNCGGPNQAPKNFCNATTMAWGCGCAHKVADFAPFLWPVVQAECSGKAQDCQMICNKDIVNPSTCAATCNAYYQCDTDKAPPSYLQTENPTDLPSYNGPKQEISTSSNENGSGGASGLQSSEATRISKHACLMAVGLVVTIATM